jgi:hypothetical protein
LEKSGRECRLKSEKEIEEEKTECHHHLNYKWKDRCHVSSPTHTHTYTHTCKNCITDTPLFHLFLKATFQWTHYVLVIAFDFKEIEL